MVSFVNSHANATRTGWHLWEIDLKFASRVDCEVKIFRTFRWKRTLR